MNSKPQTLIITILFATELVGFPKNIAEFIVIMLQRLFLPLYIVLNCKKRLGTDLVIGQILYYFLIYFNFLKYKTEKNSMWARPTTQDKLKS